MFLIALLLVVLYLPVKDWLNSVKALYAAHMTAGTFIYIAAITLAIMLLIPSSMVEIFGVIVVGPYIGFALNVTGNMIAAAASYPLGRFMVHSSSKFYPDLILCFNMNDIDIAFVFSVLAGFVAPFVNRKQCC
jgi:uncharacterized membrane protein YdjX (TVP38/TMEM64 family)